jgi:integrase
MTFEVAAYAYIAAHRKTWRSHQHAAQWPSSLRRYVFPTLGALPVSAIDTALVVRALTPAWEKVPETASRLRGRIESILDWATVSGFRQGDNPARWSGHLEHLLAAPRKRRVEHLAALPWREVPEFMARLREIDTTAAHAFEFLILTAARTGEVRNLTWDSVRLAEAIWVVPAHKMKAGKEHRVPLSARCIKILREREAVRTDDPHVFPGRDGKLGESAFQHLLKRLGRRDITAHGFRSSFRDWAGESTGFPREVAEHALAHVVGDASERSYARGDMFTKRRKLMEAWASFCARPLPLGVTAPTPMRKARADA